MSLINDALKRAGQAPPPPALDTTAAPLHPVHDPPRYANKLWLACLVALVLTTCVATWSIVLGYTSSRSKGNLTQNQAVLAREAPITHPTLPAEPSPVLEPGPPAVTQSVPIPAAKPEVPPVAPANSNAVAEQPAVAPPNLMAAAPTAPEPPKPAPLKLQAIFYRPSNPAAMINNKLLSRGDNISNARITAIDQQSVTLQRDSGTFVLTLP